MQKVALQLGPHVIHERVIDSGKDTSVILVHGLGVSGDYYLPFAKLFAKYYNVYIIDLPGYGTTPKPPKPLSIVELSDVLIDYLLQKKLKTAVAVGQSMGCQIITHAAVKEPTFISKLILLAPTVNKKERSVLMQSYRLLQDTFHEPLTATMLVLRDYARMGLRRYLETTHYMIADRIEDSLKQCRQPILIVRGEKDKIVPRKWAAMLSTIKHRYTLIEMPNAPHLLQYKKPKELVAICRDFLK